MVPQEADVAGIGLARAGDGSYWIAVLQAQSN
jgi:hypothetical protein